MWMRLDRWGLLAASSTMWFSAACAAGPADMSNAIRVIFPYRSAATWVFDDPAVGVRAEPFVSGIPEMIDRLVADVPDAPKGFRLLFSAEPFPGYQVRLTWQRPEYGGHWYRWDEQKMDGWLCPALFKYFPDAPHALYARAEPLSGSAKTHAGLATP